MGRATIRKAPLAAVIVALLLTGCGGGGGETSEGHPRRPLKARELKMTLDGRFGPQNVAVPMASQEGYFYDLGIYVSANTPLSPVRPIPYVITGTDEIGISHQPEVEMAKRRGAPIVVIGSLVTRPTMAMIWLKRSNLDAIADLKGKTVGIPGLRFQERFLGLILARAGLTLRDVKVRKVGYELVPELIGGRVDAIFGGSSNLEGVELEARGLEPVVSGVESLGIPPYEELVVIARKDLVEERPGLIRDFMSALARGTAAAVDDPVAAREALEESVNPNPEAGPRILREQLAATLPLLAEGELSPP